MVTGRLAGEALGITTIGTFAAIDASNDDTANASTAVYLPMANAIGFELDVTSAADAVDDTLDVYVQTLYGANWLTVVHFTQVLGNGGAKRYYAKVCSQLATAEFENATALGVASVRHFIGDAWRAYAIAVDGGVAGPELFSFTVKATPM